MEFWTALPVWLAALWLLRVGLLRLADRLAHQDFLGWAAVSCGLGLLIWPGSGLAWAKLGNILGDLGSWAWAARCFSLARRLRPDWIEAWLGQGIASLVLAGDSARAHEYLLKAYFLRRGEPFSGRFSGPVKQSQVPPVGLPEAPEPQKLLHDADQLELLVVQGRLGPDWLKVAERYRLWQPGQDAPPFYQRAIYLAQPQTHGPLLLPVDATAVQADFAASGGLLSWYDGFLSPDTLAQLQDFCLYSTIWHHVYANGYLGAHLDDGMSCPLLYDIAEALMQTFPEIFKDLRLVYFWAFKCREDAAGVALHHDSALVNVNFWLTPDTANLTPGAGGILVYPKEPPASWDLERYRISGPDMTRFVADVAPVRVPYAQNRVVIFNSRLFHASDSFRFAPGYAHQRLNVTLLFGKAPLRYHEKQALSQRRSN